jgi:serine/threonine-protein kinase
MSADPASPKPLEPGRRVGPYALLRLIGRGATSRVYLAWDPKHRQPVALKLMPAPADAAQRQARDNELRAAQTLRHANIIEVLDRGFNEEGHWLALEWIAGHDLAHYTVARWRLPDAIVVDVAHALALALDHAHARRVTHRDLKPSNIRVNLPAAIFKLGDFGLASLHDGSVTATGVLPGTPAYMAPEVLSGASANAASDLYALGVIVYELLASRRPHQATGLGQLLRQVASEPPTPLRQLRPDLPGELQQLVDGMLRREPGARPPHALQIAERLAALREHLPRP